MTLLTGSILVIIAGIVIGTILLQAVLRTAEPISVRSVFLVGFVVFQLLSGGLCQLMGEYDVVKVIDPARTGLIFLTLCTAFLVIFLIAYRGGWLVRRAAHRPHHVMGPISPVGAIPLALLIVAFGVFVRVIVGRNVPLLGILADTVGVGILSAAAGLAVWVWVPRLFNPAIAIPTMLIIVAAIGSLIYLTISRRDVSSLFITLLFAAYYSHWRQSGLLRASYRITAVVTAAFFFISAFSAIRGTAFKDSDITRVFQRLGEAKASEQFLAVLSGQAAGANSMWIIEHWPRDNPYEPFATLIYTYIQPIPRVLWPGKPDALGYTMARMLRTQSDFNMGPGMIGHIVHDNPWLTLIPYAVFFGLFCRYLDEFLRVRASDPFIVIPIAVGTGEILALSRGETGLFLFRALVAMFSAWVSMKLCRAIFTRFSSRPLVTYEFDSEQPEGDDDPDAQAALADDSRT